MTLVTVGSGLQLNVEARGVGPPVVLLHGFTGSALSWGSFFDRLAERHTLVSVDITGHGESAKPADVVAYRMDRVAWDVIDAIHTTGVREPAWFGYSMGGRLALYIAATYPAEVSRLALLGASAGLADEDARASRRASDEALADRIERDGIAAFVDEWERLPLWKSQARLPVEVRDAIRAGRLVNDPIGLAGSLRGMGTGAQPPLHEQLAGITIPTLLLAGEEDERYVAIGNDLARAMPNAQFEAIPAAGHAAHLENPEECVRVLAGFLSGPTST